MRHRMTSICLVIGLASGVWAQVPTKMSYQGVLTDGSGAPVADGSHSLVFELYSVSTGGSALWTETQGSVNTTNGVLGVELGSVTPIGIAFDGALWLGIAVDGGAELTPRIELTTSPYAFHAKSVDDDAVTSAKIADGAIAVGDIAAAQVVTSVNSLTDAVTLAQGANVTITPAGNTLTIASSAAGGNNLDMAYDEGGVGVGRTITADNGAVQIQGADGLHVNTGSILADGTVGTTPASGAGTRLMWIPAKGAFRAGKVTGTEWDDANIGASSTITGGEDNAASGAHATVGGGINNAASGQHGTVSGGEGSLAGGISSTVPGGKDNVASGNYSFAAGQRAKANHAGAFVWADQTAADFASTAVDQFLIRAVGGVGIGTTSPAAQLHVNNGSLLLDGTTGAIPATGAGTRMMWYPAKDAFRAGVVAGTQWDDANIGDESTVTGGSDNIASGQRSVVSGGVTNTASGITSTIGGGQLNTATALNATVAGGTFNDATFGSATIGGGSSNTASTVGSTVAGGTTNTASGNTATVGGGNANTASGQDAVVSGGKNNMATADNSTVPGGLMNEATGLYSFAAGRQAKANHPGAFVWADQTAADFASTAADQFLIRAAGEVGIGTTSPDVRLDIVGDPNGAVRISDTDADVTAKNLSIVGTQNTNADGLWRVIGGSANATDNLVDIGGGWAGYDAASIIRFHTAAAINTAGTERMRIAGNGNVGIGTTTPRVPLDIVKASTGSGQILEVGSLSFYKDATPTKAADIGLYPVGGGVTDDLVFSMYDGATWFERMRVTNGGNVGIGTAAPGEKLEVAGHILLKSAGVDLSLLFASATAGSIKRDAVTGDLEVQAQAGSDLVLQPSGNVGIGTTAPLHPLSFNSVTGTKINLYDDGTAQAKYGFGVEGSELRAAYTGFMSFYSGGYGGSEVMQINSLGKVGIGETNPARNLHVTDASAPVAAFNRTLSDGPIISIQQDGVEEGTISVAVNTISYNAFTGSHYAWTDRKIGLGILTPLTGDNRRLHDNPDSEIIYGITPSSVPNDPKILGAYLGLQESQDPAGPGNPHLVMAVGNGGSRPSFS